MFEIEGMQRSIGELRKFINRETQKVENLLINEVGKEQKVYVQGVYFGHKDLYYEISGKLIIPNNWKSSRVELEIYSSKSEWDNSTNPQMQVWLNERLIQAMDVNHHEVLLPDWVKEKGEVDFRLEVYSGREEKQFPIFINLNLVDERVRTVFYDLAVALKCCLNFEKGTQEYLAYYPVLDQAIRYLDYREPFSKNFYEGLEICRKYLKDKLYEKYDHLPFQPQVTAVGHTHIDIAWLWTVEQAIEKSRRSFSTVLKLMEEYPEYEFIQSQPQLYDLVKERYPDMYEQIKERVAEGRWEPEGSMWVEADCNLTSGESLVRQILYGKKFFKEEFGKENETLWLPDVFGYSAALPQILKKSGIPYFMTTKLSWNQFNQIPSDTFHWKGIDGSEVLTHFITTTNDGYKPSEHFTTYNGILEPKAILGSWQRYGEKEINDEILIAYGYGDGGGGPTRQMLENAQRFKHNLPGMPKVKLGKALDYFQRLEKRLEGKNVPKWMGELYFEYHRGTYTTMAKNKKDNRKSEFLLQSVEKVYAQLDSKYYPKEQLERLWKLVLLNQFHDILPGTSIKEVYDQTEKEYKLIFEEANLLAKNGLVLLAEAHQGDVDSLMVFNPLGIKRDSFIVVELEDGYCLKDNGKALMMQKTKNGKLLARVSDVPSLGYKILTLEKEQTTVEVIESVKASQVMETPYYRVVFNDTFEIVSIYDKKAEREVLPEGGHANRFVLYEDLPMGYDAWDIDIYYKKKPYIIEDLEQATLIEDGPIRKTIEVTRHFENSKITQHIHFYQSNPRIDFETWVDWQHEHNLLKVEFPVAVNTLEATFDIQYGNVKRPVHTNTSWDKARFEVCGQKWADLSEGGYGLSIMTDCKYGYDVDYQKLGLTLLRAPMDPYPNIDKGVHHFTYSIYPHQETWKEAKTVDLAYDLNVPLMVERVKANTTVSDPWLISGVCNVVIDSVKQAEDGEGLIVRLYEDQNKSTVAPLKFKASVKSLSLCDLLENEIKALDVVDDQIQLKFKPYEIHTIKLEL